MQASAGRPVVPDAVNRPGTPTILEGLYQTNVTAVVRVPQAPDRVDEPVYRIRATESTAPGASVENVSLTVTVTESGRVLEYEYVRVRRNDTGANVTVRTPIGYRGVDDTTVRRPAWVPGNTTGDVNVGRGTVVPHRSNRSPPGRVPPVARQDSVRVRQGTEGSTGSLAPADSSVRTGSTA